MRSLDAVVDELGFGLAQWRFILAAGISQAMCGAIMQTLGPAGERVSRELGISDMERGALASALFAGVLAGNLASSAADVFGRRRCYLLGTGVSALAWGSCLLASTFTHHVALRFITGLGMGLCTPALYSLISEMAPTSDRLFLSSVCGMIPFTFGMLYGVFLCHLADPTLQAVPWRPLVVYTAGPTAVSWILAVVLLPESPRFYAMRGRMEDACAALAEVGWLHGRSDVDVRNWGCAEASAVSPPLHVLLRGRLLITTLALSLSTVTLNYAYYGALYAVPELLASFESHYPATAYLAAAAAVEVGGYLFAMTVGKNVARKPMLFAYLAATSAAAALLMHRATSWQLVTGVLMSRFALSVGFVLVYTYVSEVFPTAFRSSGCATTFAIGRLGSIAAPMVAEHGGLWATALVLLAANAVAVQVLPVETKDKALSDIAAEQLPLNKNLV